MVLWSLARPRLRVSLPAVVAHERRRGGNSTPLDIPAVDTDGDRTSGPVTEVQRRVGVAVHQQPALRTDPVPLVQPKIGQVAAATVMGLGGPKPAVSHHQPPALPAHW
jgi:hypothetical protein